MPEAKKKEASKKEKPINYSFKACKKIKRPDGLRMKTVREYTFKGFVNSIAGRYGNRTAYCTYGSEEESTITYNQLKSTAISIATYLMENGIVKGDKAAIMGDGCPTWMCAYLGITYFGAVTVPILPNFSKAETETILTTSETKVVFVTVKQQEKVLDWAKQNNAMLIRLDDLVHVPLTDYGKEDFNFEKAAGFNLYNHKHNIQLVESSAPHEEDLASIIFTSGTTGNSKGVMLSNKNLVVCGDEASDVYVKIKKGYRVLSILPMSHCYEFVTCHLLTLMRGATITFLGRAVATTILMKAFKDVRPHIILTVPLIIEKVYKSAVLPTITQNQKIKNLLKNPFTAWIVYKTINTKLIATMGGSMKFFGIGGAPLDPEVEKFLYKAKFPYALGYGLTETSPLIAACGPKKKEHHIGYVGKIVKHDQVVLLNKNEEGIGEIAVKGPNVMMGYYKRDDLNAEAFTQDGYFKTGDLGYIKGKKLLAIKGRVKTMILGPGGENIYPENIESLINNQEFVQESLVIPSDSGLKALIKIDIEAYQNKLKLSAADAKVEAGKYLDALKKKVNQELSSFSRINETELQEQPFERTPTQKIKRFLYTRKKKDSK